MKVRTHSGVSRTLWRAHYGASLSDNECDAISSNLLSFISTVQKCVDSHGAACEGRSNRADFATEMGIAVGYERAGQFGATAIYYAAPKQGQDLLRFLDRTSRRIKNRLACAKLDIVVDELGRDRRRTGWAWVESASLEGDLDCLILLSHDHVPSDWEQAFMTLARLHRAGVTILTLDTKADRFERYVSPWRLLGLSAEYHEAKQ